MTPTQRKVMEMALDSIKELVADPETDFGPSYGLMKERQRKAIKALRAALAEPVSEEPDETGLYHNRAHEESGNSRPAHAVRHKPVSDEPVAFMEAPYGEIRINRRMKFSLPPATLEWRIPLYTYPPKREPLTETAISELARQCVKAGKPVEWALRAVERYHGIGGDK